MEELTIVLGNRGDFDKAVHCGTAQASPVTVITKDHAMGSGASGAVISFDIELDGKIIPVQATVSTKLLIGLGNALLGRYDEFGILYPHQISDGSAHETGTH